MITKTESPKGEDEVFFANWKKDLEASLKGKSFPEEKTNLLQCPYTVRLNQLKNSVKHEPFLFWGKEAVVDFGTSRFLKMVRVTKSHQPNLEKALPIVKTYRDGNNNKKGEENCLSFLYEKPGDANICPQEGAVVDSRGTYMKYPSVLSEEARDFLRFRVSNNLQQLITPLGKKGLVAFHTQNQYCSLDNLGNGSFQRFFIGPSPENSLIRIAHTLSKLAGADPKTIGAGLKRIKSLYLTSLKEFGQKILRDINNCIETSYIENLDRSAKQFSSYGLPYLDLSKGGGSISLELCSDLNEGYRYQTSAISLKIDTEQDYFHNQVTETWKSLTK
jgi:hypothetical protein